ncbi:MAG: 3'-5' exoribonuclease YhaM family protein, partial [Pseudobdellovibrionaceae bacterium]
RTGTIDARAWDRVEELAREFSAGDVVWVKGQVQSYQNRKQFVIHKIQKDSTENKDMSLYMDQSERNSEKSLAELRQIIGTLQNSHLKQLVTDSVEDPEVRVRLMKSPAAKTIHHAWPGGLLEHMVSICKIMDFMAIHYSFLNRDLLIFGAIFHDFGKLWELEDNGGIHYTDRGRLIGHMEIACELIDKKASRILGFPEELRDLCKHIVLSHHGKLEYGSPKRPKFLEALVVALVDDLDSKINTVESFVKSERMQTSEKWSRYNSLFDRYFLLEDLKNKF